VRKGRRRAEQAGLRMGDEFDRQSGHHGFEPPLGAKALGKARGAAAVADAIAQPAGDHDARAALRQRDIARDAAQRQAEAVDGGGGKAVFAPTAPSLPQRRSSSGWIALPSMAASVS
jgi:hypothetical protein